MKRLFTDKKLVYRVMVHKDPEAFGQLYHTYIDRIYRFIYFKVSNKEEAEDVTSEVFLKTWHYLTGKELKEVTSFSGLIYKVARNCLVDFYRVKSQRQELPLESALELGVHDKRYHDIALKQEAAQILQVVAKLKREYQEVILLKYIEELSVGEIAIILDKSPTNIRVTLHRALKVVKELLRTSSSLTQP